MPRLAFRSLALLAIVGLVAAVVGAQAPTPTDLDQRTAQVVVRLLEQGHMAKPKIDDETAKKWCHNFVKDLDPQKVYFEKADVDGFHAQATTLDDKIKEGNLDFARSVFERYLQRCDERLAIVMDLLKEKPDFKVDESITDDPEKLQYPANTEEAKERWRKKIKFEWLQLKLEKLDDDEIVKRLKVRYRDRNRMVHQFDMTDLLEVYLSSLTRTFDPHSNYMGAKTLEDTINQTLHLSLEGIGASLMSEDGYAVVKEIVPGMAADKDGRLAPDDKIVGIQNADGSETDLVEKKLSDVVRYIRGPRGTKVRLIVVPAGTKERKVYELTREKIELKEQHAKGQVIETKGEDGKPIKLGVIALPAFYGDTEAVFKRDPEAVSATEDCRKLIEGFKKQNVNAVVIDLRGNGGGLLQEAITLSGLFIDEGPVVQVKEASGVKELDDVDRGTAWDGPLAVLIDHLSASASEIFAGVIKDYGRGLIIGDSSTFGKGTVQSIVPIRDQFLRRRDLPNLGALKLTIQQFYRANGESTQIRGVTPDVHIPSIRDMADFGEGKMDNALKFDKVAPLEHERFNLVPAELIQKLQVRSDDRRKTDSKFQKQEERIKKYAERKARHLISLNEEKFKAEFVPDDDGDKEVDTKSNGKDKKKKFVEHPAWESDYYNDEVVRIISDYLTLGSKVLASTGVRAANR